MKLYHFKSVKQLPMSIEETWGFFSSPMNLSKITPPEMGFEVLTELPEKVYPGLIIQYKVRPILSIPMRWVTEITQAKEPFYFIDEQRFGPYKFWHHQHLFAENENGVEMTDIVHYALPFSLFGNIANSILVKKQLKHIFDYRSKAIDDFFNLTEK